MDDQWPDHSTGGSLTWSITWSSQIRLRYRSESQEQSQCILLFTGGSVNVSPLRHSEKNRQASLRNLHPSVGGAADRCVVGLTCPSVTQVQSHRCPPPQSHSRFQPRAPPASLIPVTWWWPSASGRYTCVCSYLSLSAAGKASVRSSPTVSSVFKFPLNGFQLRHEEAPPPPGVVEV